MSQGSRKCRCSCSNCKHGCKKHKCRCMQQRVSAQCMQVMRQKSCIQQEPIVITVHNAGDTHRLSVNKGFLTVCKKRIQEGHSAELYRDDKYLLTYTKLPTRKKFINLHQFYNGQLFLISTLNIMGERFEVVQHDRGVNVWGLENVASNIMLREFHIPSLNFVSMPLQSMSDSFMYSDKQKVLNTIKAMQLTVPHKVLHNTEFKVFKTHGIVKSYKASERVARVGGEQENKMCNSLNLQAARRMLWFNNTAVSKVRSLFTKLPVDFARNVVLNLALAHAGTHAEANVEKVLLAHTFQYAKLSHDAMDALTRSMTLTTKPCGMISYLNDSGVRVKVPLFSMPTSCVSVLKREGFVFRQDTGYLSKASDGTPILIADIVASDAGKTCPGVSPSQQLFNKHESLTRDLRRRLYLHTACTYHPSLYTALHALLRASTLQHDVFSKTPSVGLDLWAFHTAYDAQADK